MTGRGLQPYWHMGAAKTLRLCEITEVAERREVLEYARRELVHSFIPGTAGETGKPRSRELLRE